MLLTSLELNGFKSFAQKTTLKFPSGITAIVGPNGSGKSNVIDAIRWLLGEREAKHLRGAKAEDLIFHGTPARPRVGVASAGIYFDNSSGFFPVDFKEVVVMRKVARDGTAQYFLNKSEVRLKDIIDFFNRSRLGTKGFTVINQGSSDMFVRATPQERRVMVEEILGLREYQIKKEEAERKLKATVTNVEKVRAMIEEVLPRLRSLARQTKKWEKREEVADELMKIENAYFSYKLGGIEKGKGEYDEELKGIAKKIENQKSTLAKAESALKNVEGKSSQQDEFKELRDQQRELQQERDGVQRDLIRLETKLEMLSQKSTSETPFDRDEALSLMYELRDALENISNMETIEEVHEVVTDLAMRIEKFLEQPNEEAEGKEYEFTDERKKLVANLKSIEKEINILAQKERKMTEGFESFREVFRKAFEHAEREREKLRSLEEQKSRLKFEIEKLEMRMQEVEHQLQQTGRKLSEFKPTTHHGEGSLDDMERKMLRLRGELASIGEIDEALIKEANEVKQHHAFLSEQSVDLERAAKDLEGLVKDLNQKIHAEFNRAMSRINEGFNKFFKLMFSGGQAKLKLQSPPKLPKKKKDELDEPVEEAAKEGESEEETRQITPGLEIEINLPRKRITSLEMLSGGEKSLVSIAALFALISVSPPPFLVLDEVDAALDENNSKRFASLIKEFSKKTQFIVVTHNRMTMEAAEVLYGVTLGEDGASKVLSVKLEEREPARA